MRSPETASTPSQRASSRCSCDSTPAAIVMTPSASAPATNERVSSARSRSSRVASSSAGSKDTDTASRARSVPSGTVSAVKSTTPMPRGPNEVSSPRCRSRLWRRISDAMSRWCSPSTSVGAVLMSPSGPCSVSSRTRRVLPASAARAGIVSHTDRWAARVGDTVRTSATALRSAQWVTGSTPAPVSRAARTSGSGSRPRPGSSQRTTPSTPSTAPVASETTGR